MTEAKRHLKVFLCHAHADRDAVRGLYTRLTKDGVDAWLDKEKLLPGQDWELEIRKAVREADVIVVCLSKQFNQAGFRQKEVRLALETAMEKPEGEIFIVPARLEECDTLESLRKWHWVDLFDSDGHRMLLRALRIRAGKIGAILRIKDEHFQNAVTPIVKSEKPILDLHQLVEKNIREKAESSANTTLIQKLSWSKRKTTTKRLIAVTAQILLAVMVVSGLVFSFGESLIESWFYPTPVNVSMAMPTCISTAIGINPYLSYQQSQTRSGAVAIYDDFKTGSISFDDARRRAFSQLMGSTEHWSDYADVAIDDKQMIRITVTYIDPALVEYIILNNVFLPNVNTTNDDTNTFISKLSAVLNKLAERDEMLFMLIITTPIYSKQAYNTNVLNVKIPLRNIALVNGPGLRVYPTHYDQILDETIDITHGPVAGVIGYPLSVKVQENCTWVIDEHTNALTLDVPEVALGETKLGSQFWHIPYRSLIEVDIDNIDFIYDPYADLDRIQRLEEPPRPNWVPNATNDMTDQKTYWEDMGRFIWDYFMKNNDF